MINGEQRMAPIPKKEKFNQIAEESSKTQKAREKLKKQLEAVDKKITQQAIEKKTIEIHRWIARHASNRVPLPIKGISLFDENQNAAELSGRIKLLAEQIKVAQEPENSVRESFGKIKKISID